MKGRLLWLLLVNLGLLGLCGLFSPNFLRPPNLLGIANNLGLELVVLAAACLLMIGGQLDLSLDGVVAMTGVISGKLLSEGCSVVIALLGGIGAGLAAGLTSGTLINRFRLNPFVATLAVGWLAYGVAYGVTQGSSIWGFPPAFGLLGQAQVAGFRVTMLYGLVWLGVLAVLLERTVLGAHIYLVGDNAEACRLMGVGVDRVRLFLYGLSGFSAGVVGVVLAARLDAATPIAADGIALRVIAAAVIGGCLLSGGAGSVLGGALGLVLMNVLANAAILFGVSVYWQKAIIGGALLGAVLLDSGGNRFGRLAHIGQIMPALTFGRRKT